MRSRILLTAVLAVAPAPLAPQQAPTHSSTWIGAGAGIGWARVHCRICTTNRGHSLSGYAHAGGRLSNRVLIGGEVQGWFRNGDARVGRPADELLLAYNAVAFWYPSPHYSYYLKGGLGLVTYRIADSTGRVTATALGPQVGAGWEIPVAGNASVVPFVNLLLGSIGTRLKNDGTPIPGLSTTSLGLIQFGLGVERR
jgi:hypothetical protein